MDKKKLLTPGDPKDAMNYFKEKISFTTGPVEVKSFQDTGEDFVFVDVREEEDFAKGHPAGAINLPKAKWNTFEGLQKDKVNILLCYSAVCHLAAKAAVKFASQGYPVMEMDGGFEAWQENNMPVETGAAPAERKSA